MLNVIIRNWHADVSRIHSDLIALNTLISNFTDSKKTELESKYKNLCLENLNTKGNFNFFREEVIDFLEDGKNINFLILSLTQTFPLCALGMYHVFYKNNNDKLLSYHDINSNPIFKNAYQQSGGDSISFAYVTAIKWYTSEFFHDNWDICSI